MIGLARDGRDSKPLFTKLDCVALLLAAVLRTFTEVGTSSWLQCPTNDWHLSLIIACIKA